MNNQKDKQRMAKHVIEDEYWKHNYSKRASAEKNVHCDVYQPAYRTGYEGFIPLSRQEVRSGGIGLAARL